MGQPAVGVDLRGDLRRRDRVTPAGERDILGFWAGTAGGGAKFWTAVLIDPKNRGVGDSFFVVCDGLKGLPEVVNNVWPQAIVQTCIIHLIRNTFRFRRRPAEDPLRAVAGAGIGRGSRLMRPS